MTLTYQKFAITVYCLLQLIHSGCALRMLDIQLPSIAIYNKPAQLNCTYELEQDQLYSIKWYHNDNEFYRYLPNDDPPEQFYHTKGLYVDLTKSSKSLVYLKKVDLRTDGLFRVEVSAEAPSFQTVRKEKYLNVYYFPREAPTVRLKNRTNDLRINDVLDVSCQSGPARPATKLQFFINDIPISQAFANLTESVSPIVLEDESEMEENEIFKGFEASSNQEQNSIDDYPVLTKKDINHSSSSSSLVLFNTTLRLRIRLRQSLLKAKKTLNLRCASYNTHVFTKSSEHVFQVLAPVSTQQDGQDLSRGNGQFSNRKRNSSLKNFNKKTFGPFIDNTRSNYAVGDLINVTCFTASSKPPAFLQWYIDETEAPSEYLRYYKPIETKDGLRSLLGLEFKLSEEFLASQQQPTTTTLQPLSSSDSSLDGLIISSTSEYSSLQDMVSESGQASSANQTAIKLINKKREIKLKCTAQLSRIVHVRTRQFSLGDQSKLGASVSRNGITVDHLHLDTRLLSLVSYLFAYLYSVHRF